MVPTLTRQEWPAPPLSPTNERSAVSSLSIPIVVVAVPAGSEGSLDLEHGVHDPQRIHNQRIIRFSDSITYQFEKPCIDNVLGRELVLNIRRTVRNVEHAAVGILLWMRIVNALRKNPYVVPADPGHKRT